MEDLFTEIARFPSRLEAEAVGHALDQYGIPFLIKNDDVGIFGPGMVGWSPSDARLLVPTARRAEVAELLTCVVKPLDPEDLDWQDPDSNPDEEE